MRPQFLTFKKFYHLQQAEQVKLLLEEENFEVQLITPRKALDDILVGNTNDSNYELRILNSEFTRANQVLQSKFKVNVTDVSSDYYLFDSTDEELYDILLHYDDWNLFDYQLAKEILKTRGKEVNDELVTSLINEKHKAEAEQEKAPQYLIIGGYLLCIFGSVLGILVGIHLVSAKKKLADGRQIAIFNEKSRNEGKIMIGFAILMFVGYYYFFFKDMI